MNPPSVRDLLKGYIHRAGLTQAEVAERTGYNESTFSRLLSDNDKLLKNLPKLRPILRLSEREQADLLILLGVMPTHSERRVPLMALEPDDYVPRTDEFERLVRALTGKPERSANTTVAITAALRGAGGFGKTTLAQIVCYDSRVLQAFPDGILWVTLGKEPGNLIDKVDELVHVLTGSSSNAVSLNTATVALRDAIGQRTMLLVIDDVWEPAHLWPFLQGGQHCVRLITTRDRATLPHRAVQIDVDAMRPAEAVDLLRTGLPGGDPDVFLALATRLGEWPLLLKLTNGQLRRRVNSSTLNQSLPEALDYVNEALDRHGITAFDLRNQSERSLAVSLTLEHSFDLLSEIDRLHYTELAIFPEDVDIPLETLTQLWGRTGGLDAYETEELCDRLYQLSLLLHFNFSMRTIRLHDVIRAYLLQGQQTELPQQHRNLLDAYRPAVSQVLPHGTAGSPWAMLSRDEIYMWRYLAYHLGAAQQIEELRTVLFDFRWLHTKLYLADISTLIADYDGLAEDLDSRRIQEALRLSAHVLANDRAQFAAQLLGRLLATESVSIQSLLAQARAEQPRPWLCPLLASLMPPGPLVRTLSGHSNEIWSIAMATEVPYVISAADDNTLKVWDIERGVNIKSLRGHTNRVRSVAVTPNGRWVFSGSKDRTVKAWNLHRGKEIQTLHRHTDGIDSVAVTDDGQWIISGSEDKSIIIWSWPAGRAEHVLSGHTDRVLVVAVSADGQTIVSGSKDRTLRVWDLHTGNELMTLTDHRGGVWTVAFTSDNRHILSGSDDRTVKLWNLETGAVVRTFTGHMSGVRSICILPDGQRMLSLTENGILHVWQIRDGSCLATIPAHERAARSAAVTSDGQFAITASADRSLRIWNLNLLTAQRHRAAHIGSVRAVAISADGQRAVSAGADGSIKVWNVAEQSIERTLPGHNEHVNAIAISRDGQIAVSASNDKTLKMWYLADGALVQTLKGHTAAVTAVALSADHHRAISGSNDQTVIVWDLQTGAIEHRFEGHAAKIRDVALSADGLWGLSAADKAVTVTPDRQRILHTSLRDVLKVWRLDEGRLELNLSDHTDGVVSVAITADGRRAISAATDSSLKIWDVLHGTVLATFKKGAANIQSVAFAQSGMLAISASNDKVLTIWDTTDGKIITQFNTDSALQTCAVSDDGATVIAGDAQGNVHLFQYYGSAT